VEKPRTKKDHCRRKRNLLQIERAILHFDFEKEDTPEQEKERKAIAAEEKRKKRGAHASPYSILQAYRLFCRKEYRCFAMVLDERRELIVVPD